MSLFLAAANIVSSILLAYFFLDSASSFYFLWVSPFFKGFSIILVIRIWGNML